MNLLAASFLLCPAVTVHVSKLPSGYIPSLGNGELLRCRVQRVPFSGKMD